MVASTFTLVLKPWFNWAKCIFQGALLKRFRPVRPEVKEPQPTDRQAREERGAADPTNKERHHKRGLARGMGSGWQKRTLFV